MDLSTKTTDFRLRTWKVSKVRRNEWFFVGNSLVIGREGDGGFFFFFFFVHLFGKGRIASSLSSSILYFTFSKFFNDVDLKVTFMVIVLNVWFVHFWKLERFLWRYKQWSTFHYNNLRLNSRILFIVSQLPKRDSIFNNHFFSSINEVEIPANLH